MSDLDEGNDPTEEIRRTQEAPDQVLQLIVLAAHKGIAELGITLTVSGTLISGRLVGRDRWFRELAEWSDSQQDGAGTLPRTIGEEILAAEEENELPPLEATHMGFIHLVDAHIFGGPAPMPTSNGFFWRGRLSQVSGFALGNLST